MYGFSWSCALWIVHIRQCGTFLPHINSSAQGFLVLQMAEEQQNPTMRPTRYNIHMAMVWLVQGCQPGDSLVFHYSGHGSQQRDYAGEEQDGYNETICPIDFETQGMIVDNEINDTIVKPLPYGVRLNAIIDACHSGTVLDLPYVCRFNRFENNLFDFCPVFGRFLNSVITSVITKTMQFFARLALPPFSTLALLFRTFLGWTAWPLVLNAIDLRWELFLSVCYRWAQHLYSF